MAQDSELINQDEIERLLQQAQSGARPEAKPASAAEGADPRQVGNAPVGGRSAEAVGVVSTAKPQAAQSLPTNDDADKLLAQDDIEKLLSQSGKAAAPKPSAKDKPTQTSLPSEGEPVQDDIEYLLQQAEQALASVDAQSEGPPPGVTAFRFQEFAGAPASTENTTLDLIRDVELDLRIELGRTHMYLEDVLRLRKGSVVPLDKLAGDPVDVFVNGRLIARGEVLVLNDSFCVRVAELIAGASPAA